MEVKNMNDEKIDDLFYCVAQLRGMIVRANLYLEHTGDNNPAFETLLGQIKDLVKRCE